MTSNPQFGAETTATEVATALGASIKGKNVVVTGVSPASIGYTTVVAIASQGPATLILASRTQSKLDAVAADLANSWPSVTVKSVLLDLSLVASIRATAAAIGELVDHVDVLINNAGVSTPERGPLTTPDGSTLDTQMFTNHLGVFLLTALLLPLLRAGVATSGAARIVNVSSHGHRLSPVRFSDYAFQKGLTDVPDGEKPTGTVPPFFAGEVDGYPGFLGYGQSKTANILHASELGRRLRGTGITAFSVHPGTIETELSRSLNNEGLEVIAKTAPKGLWKTQDQGAATSVVAGFDPALTTADVGGTTVGYMSDCQLCDEMVAPHAAGAEAARRLWEESERMLQLTVGL